MSTNAPDLICEENVSYAWAHAFLRTMERSERTLAPLTVSFTGFSEGGVSEDPVIRDALDTALADNHKYSSAVSAMHIFPYSHWIRTGLPSPEELFDWYLDKLLPRLRARDFENRYGTYFERMIDYSGAARQKRGLCLRTTNQLKHIIDTWNRRRDSGNRVRRSALQVACFDPIKDHTGQCLRGFPCLQQISLTYHGDDLAVNGYYPTQYIFDRAYGNYLGLSHLGMFMAREMGLHLVRVNCYIGRPELGSVSKSALARLASAVREVLIRVGRGEVHNGHTN